MTQHCFGGVIIALKTVKGFRDDVQVFTLLLPSHLQPLSLHIFYLPAYMLIQCYQGRDNRLSGAMLASDINIQKQAL